MKQRMTEEIVKEHQKRIYMRKYQTNVPPKVFYQDNFGLKKHSGLVPTKLKIQQIPYHLDLYEKSDPKRSLETKRKPLE
ncbi:hypothetical protein LguiA_022829 [Lonicera macranthoides]